MASFLGILKRNKMNGVPVHDSVWKNVKKLAGLA